MFKNKLSILVLLIALAVVTTGCVTFKTSDEAINDAGVYKTVNKGDKWVQKVLIPSTSGKPKSIGGVNVNLLVMDPSDNNAIYFGSFENGLFYTYDGANSWRVARGLGRKTINALVVDPNSKCVIYASIANAVFKSRDCNRSWERIYIDNSVKTGVKAVAVDFYDSSIVYIGTSRGEIIKSYDGGATWQTIERFKNEVKEIIISPHDSRTIFAATKGKGIYRTYDSGGSWDNLGDNLKEFKSSKSYRDIVVSKAEPGLIFIATDYGLLKSVDNGDNWASIELITPVKGAIINAIAVNPKNTDEIYYVTSTTFYRSLDGGRNWTPKKLPTTGAGWKLLIDPENPNIIYMGVKKYKK